MASMPRAIIGQIPYPERKRFLLEPLSWLMDRLGAEITADPCLSKAVIELDPARMHLVGLALAYLSGKLTAKQTLLLFRGPRHDVLDLALGSCPAGLNRALHRLPP